MRNTFTGLPLRFLVLFILFTYLLVTGTLRTSDIEKFMREISQGKPAGSVLNESSDSFHPVVKVVDGDTITVSVNGQNETVRLIGVNTPETVDPRRGIECFGREASNYMKLLLENRRVRLEEDNTQDDRDRYRRLLRYVYRDDGVFINKKLISEGFAYEYTYDTPYVFQSEFIYAQQEARETGKGLWATSACGER